LYRPPARPSSAGMSGRKLTPAERRGWSRVVRNVRPLPGVEPHPLPEPEPETGPETGPRAVPKSAAPAPVRGGNRPPAGAAPSPGREPAEPRAPAGVPERANDRRLRRGQVTIDARFDLHGLTQAEAEQRLPAFLEVQRKTGGRCVLVITGKGRGGEGVLRRNFLHWLESGAARHLVASFAPAHPRHGGSGAFYVFLRRPG